MIDTKIKCDAGYHYSYQTGTADPTVAVSQGWYEIDVRPGVVSWHQPKTSDSFLPQAKHACCPEHARELVASVVIEQIKDWVKEKESEVA